MTRQEAARSATLPVPPRGTKVTLRADLIPFSPQYDGAKGVVLGESGLPGFVVVSWPSLMISSVWHIGGLSVIGGEG